MSATITTDIFCDNESCSQWDADCGVSGTNITRVREARKKAKNRGWLYVRIEGKMKDICPNCAVEADKEGAYLKEFCS